MTLSSTKWRAEFEGSVLHISGVEKYPDRFSTAGLERLKEEDPSMICYRLVFHQDKEPYCDLDCIGPVHHFERDVSAKAQRIRVFVGVGSTDFPITRK